MHFFSIKNLSKSVTFLFIVFSILTANTFAQEILEYPENLVRKEEAISKLGNRLPAVARKHGKSAEELRRLLREDETLFLDQTDRLLYIDPARENLDEYITASTDVPQAAPFPYSQTFALHSRPGSNRVIYLDFNGHLTSGTVWNTNFTGGQAINSLPFSLDGDPNSFNQQEQDVIQYIWQRVAEDYAPFDVNVTTEDPGDAAIIRSNSSDLLYGTRAVVSPTNFTGSPLGGIAFLGVFNSFGSSYKPAFVMTGGLPSEKSIAEAISHEVGHNFNLDHDGTAATGYYLGHGDWAPIMGAGYYRNVSQWSRGEYPGANQFQDDMAIMQNYGVTLIADDHANGIAGATVLSGSSISASGLITTRNDVDVFQFSTGSGNVVINLNPAPLGANLDIEGKISNAQGVVLATVDPAGLSAGFNQFLSAGVYYLTIDGVGAGNLVTGYSDYGSVGKYSITGTLAATGSQPPVAAVSVTTTSGTVPLTVGFSSSGSSDPDGSIVGYSWNFGDGGTSTQPNPVKTYNSVGTFTAVLTVTDNSGLTDTESISITVQQPAQSTVMFVNSITMFITAQHRGQATVTIRNTNGAPVPNVMVTGTWSGLAIGVESEMTDQNGVITFTSRENWKPGAYTFTVNSLSAPGYTYNPAQNIETSDFITQCFLSECS